jgi:hypothetical protein
LDENRAPYIYHVQLVAREAWLLGREEYRTYTTYSWSAGSQFPVGLVSSICFVGAVPFFPILLQVRPSGELKTASLQVIFHLRGED